MSCFFLLWCSLACSSVAYQYSGFMPDSTWEPVGHLDVQSRNRRWPRSKLNFQSYTYIMHTHIRIYIYTHDYIHDPWYIHVYILYISIYLSIYQSINQSINHYLPSIVGINGSSSAPGSDHPQNDSSRHHQVTEFFWATPQVAKSCPFSQLLVNRVFFLQWKPTNW